jgi:hypothetical protein
LISNPVITQSLYSCFPVFWIQLKHALVLIGQWPARVEGLSCRFLNMKSVFGSMDAVTFQIAFRAKIHANDIFLFF